MLKTMTLGFSPLSFRDINNRFPNSDDPVILLSITILACDILKNKHTKILDHSSIVFLLVFLNSSLDFVSY